MHICIYVRYTKGSIKSKARNLPFYRLKKKENTIIKNNIVLTKGNNRNSLLFCDTVLFRAISMGIEFFSF